MLVATTTGGNVSFTTSRVTMLDSVESPPVSNARA